MVAEGVRRAEGTLCACVSPMVGAGMGTEKQNKSESEKEGNCVYLIQPPKRKQASMHARRQVLAENQ